MKFTPYLMLLAAVLCISLFFSCTSPGLDFPPPPDGYNSSGDSSSSGGSNNGSSSSGGSSSSVNQSSSSGSNSSVVSSSGGGSCTGGFEGDKFIDSRDCEDYGYEIGPGNRIWMSENLRYSKNGTRGYCYKEGDEATELGEEGEEGDGGCISPYGRNYSYLRAVDGSANANTDKTPGLCPDGWHIPNVTEWNTIKGSGKMSTAFYVLPGNYDTGEGIWANKDNGGFYWYSDAKKTDISHGNYGYVLINGWGTPVTIEVRETAKSPYEPPTGYNLANLQDYYNVRCIMNEDFQPTCGGSPLDLATQKCVGGTAVDK